MKSAYLTLGIPGNATSQDIEEAFAKASAHYAPERLAADPQALDKFLEVKNAYQILRDGESRAAHDRKLLAMQSEPASSSRPARPARLEEPEPAWYTRPLPILGVVVVLVFSTGFYFNAKHEAARQERAAQELALKQLAAEEAQKEELRLAREEAERKKQEQLAEQKAARQEEQMRQDASRSLANARAAEALRTYQENQRQSAELREAQRKEYEAKMRQQALAREAQQRVASDKARIRELCYQNYRRYDC